jgi:manganese-dependent inorganic pyrophosphatase
MNANAKVFVIGHRNPDTDSICSAIAYAELLRLQGWSNVRPARAGNINQQTEFILNELGVEAPRLLSDVHPRIKDVVTEAAITIDQSAPMSKAIELYHKHHIRMLPVVDEDCRPKGLLLLKRVSEIFLVPTEPERLRRVCASLASIQDCLQAEALNLCNETEVEEFNLYVGARQEATFECWVDEITPHLTILITGDRPEIQRIAIEAGVRLLIVSGQSEVDPDLLQLARRKGVSVLVSKYDTANCVLLTRMATPVGVLVEEDFIRADPNDLIDDLRNQLVHSKYPGAVVVDDEGRVTAVASKSHLIKDSPVKLVLVDHNELSQAVPGADKVEILEVIDHHRLGNFHTDMPIRFINQPLGSTCSLVSTLYRQTALDPSPQIAGLLLAGLLSDTVILKSPTTTDIDRNLVPWLEQLSGLKAEDFGNRLFSAGSPMASGASSRELILNDLKEYQVAERLLGLAQVEVVNFHSFHQRREELLAELQLFRQERGYDLAALLVTDIVMETSLLLAAGPVELPYIIDYPQVREHLYRLDGVLSRKKQLVPHLLKIFKKTP